MTDRPTKIVVNYGKDVFHFSGHIIEDEGDFLVFDEVREGVIKLNKQAIIKISGGGFK